MHALIERQRGAIAELCREHRVRRLEVFGSGARAVDFDPQRSDVDFLVEFDTADASPTLRDFFALRDELSEYYDRDRSAFCRAVRSVREADMDLTGWLEFFIGGRATQLAEVKARGEAAIRRDILVRAYRLNARERAAGDGDRTPATGSEPGRRDQQPRLPATRAAVTSSRQNLRQTRDRDRP